jgi:hypothetical protein
VNEKSFRVDQKSLYAWELDIEYVADRLVLRDDDRCIIQSLARELVSFSGPGMSNALSRFGGRSEDGDKRNLTHQFA